MAPPSLSAIYRANVCNCAFTVALETTERSPTMKWLVLTFFLLSSMLVLTESRPQIGFPFPYPPTKPRPPFPCNCTFPPCPCDPPRPFEFLRVKGHV
ncbi:arasin 1-like [Penaeus japonicus]|uniref:arasin 1-like n=1 Tax=Penaeus japonicus TaxID=27405 RepID=UPI001C7152F0|nr:arasin 1-like [Penaeus japonicus]